MWGSGRSPASDRMAPGRLRRAQCPHRWQTLGLAVAGARQVEFPGAADRCPAVVHAELGVDVLGVSPYGVQRHDKLASDVRAAQVGSEQPKHLQLTCAQWLDQALSDGGE